MTDDGLRKAKKLSLTQIDTLGQALNEWNIRYRTYADDGWFWPDRHECAAVITTPQTCKSLCGMGLLEFKTWDYHKDKGKWRALNQYRITQAGIEKYQELEAAPQHPATSPAEGGGE